MELEPIGVSNRLFYYTSGGENSAFDACFRFDFTEELAPELLRESASQALKSFPEFAIRPVIHEGTVWAMKNDAPVPLLPEGTSPVCYGTEETGGYIFAFRPQEKGFDFSCFHGMSDFYGVWEFLRTVLCHYALAKGLAEQADDGIRLTPFSSMDRLEQLDPYRKFMTKCQPGTKRSAAFAIPEKAYPPEETDCTSYEILCPLKDFLAAAKAQNASVTAFLSLTTARAISTLYDVGQQPIVVMVPADMRPFFHTATAVNFSDATFLRYDAELKSLPPEKQGAALKQQLRTQMSPEHFAPLIAEKAAMADDFVHSGLDIFQWNERFAGPPLGPNTITVPLSYPGKLDLPPAYSPLLSGISNTLYYRGPGSFGIIGATYGDTMYIRSCQRFDSPAIMQGIRAKLEKAGLKADLHKLPPYRGNQLITKKLLQI